jgi:biopolymer transport protein ExbB
MAAETQQPSEFLKMFQTIIDGGPVPQTILAVLGLMSVVSWFITITKMLEQRTLNKQYGDIQREAQKGGFWSGNLRDNIEKLKGKNHAYRAIAEEGLRAAEHHEGHLSDQMALHEWITISLQRAVDAVSNRMTSVSGSWRPLVPRRPLSDCSERSSVFTVRCKRSQRAARPASKRLPAQSANL